MGNLIKPDSGQYTHRIEYNREAKTYDFIAYQRNTGRLAEPIAKQTYTNKDQAEREAGLIMSYLNKRPCDNPMAEAEKQARVNDSLLVATELSYQERQSQWLKFLATREACHEAIDKLLDQHSKGQNVAWRDWGSHWGNSECGISLGVSKRWKTIWCCATDNSISIKATNPGELIIKVIDFLATNEPTLPPDDEDVNAARTDGGERA